MRINGRTSHCDDVVRAGHRNAARGNAGALTRASGREGGLSMPLRGLLALRRGLCSDAEGPAIVTADVVEVRNARTSYEGRTTNVLSLCERRGARGLVIILRDTGNSGWSSSSSSLPPALRAVNYRRTETVKNVTSGP